MKAAHLITALILTGIAPTSASAVPPAHDTRTSQVLFIKEDALNFDAVVSISSIDDQPPNANNGIDSTNFVSVVGVNWSFEVSDSVVDWKFAAGPPPAPLPANPNGAHNLVMFLRGKHKVAPHAGEIAPNTLPLKRGLFINLPWWAWADLACRTFHVKHTGGAKVHYDMYGAMGHKTAVQGLPNSITGPVEIVARHRERSEETLPFKVTYGGSSGGGAKATYDAPTHSLRLHVGTPDIANPGGSMYPPLDPMWDGDIAFDTNIPDIVMPLIGPTGDGGYRFGPGHFEAIDPQGEITLSGDFGEFIIRDTSRTGPLDSFALFDSLTAVSNGSCRSAFINDFARIDMMGRDLTSSELASFDGAMLTFVTPQNLATLTAGFTLSAVDVPATVVVSGSRGAASQSGVAPLPDRGEVITSTRSFPNPFTRAATIEYELAKSATVTVEVFDPMGRLVRRLSDRDEEGAGSHRVEWDARTESGADAPAGIYFYRVIGGSHAEGKRFVLVR